MFLPVLYFNDKPILIYDYQIMIKPFKRSDKKSGCKDISVSGCSVDEEYLIQEVLIFQTIEQCQYYCNLLNNCLTFRFDGEKCSLMKRDDHKDCLISGGPPVL